jgi:hypothetical protein
MIPLCAREKIFWECDGIKWLFQPKVGTLEYDMSVLFDTIRKDGQDQKTIIAETDKYFNRIIKGWEGANMPTFNNENPAEHFSNDEKIEIILAWAKANSLTNEEKKS